MNNIFKIQKNQVPSLDYFKVWGCLVKVSLSVSKEKIGPKLIDCFLISYAHNSYALQSFEIKLNSIWKIKMQNFFQKIFPMKDKVIEMFNMKQDVVVELLKNLF